MKTKSKPSKLKVQRAKAGIKQKVKPRRRASSVGCDLIYSVGRCDTETYTLGVQKRAYHIWHSMFQRCYDPKWHARHPTYIGCTVSKEWHLFSSFEHWFDRHHVETYQLDKDILVPGNKVYGAKTCCFVPREINTLLTDSRRARGKYPQGVGFHKKSGRLVVQMMRYGKKVHLGMYPIKAVRKAADVYLAAKRSYIVEVAGVYHASGRIPKSVYVALLRLAKFGSFL